MKLRRLENPKGYTSLPTKTLADDRMSFRAVGILAYLLSRPDGWETDSKRLAAGEGREGRDAVRTALKQLEKLGYLHRVKVRLPAGLTQEGRYVGGQIVTEYFVSDHPTKHPGHRLQLVDAIAALGLDDAEAWKSGPGHESDPQGVDNPVGTPVENTPPGPGKPTPENPAPLTNPEKLIPPPLIPELTTDSPHVEEADSDPMVGAAPLGLAALAEDGESPLARSLEQMALVGAAAHLEPRIRMFTLRAELRQVMGYRPTFQEVYDWVEHAHESVGRHRRGRLTTAELVAYVASFFTPLDEETSGLAAAAPPGGLPAAEGPASRPGELRSEAVPDSASNSNAV